MPRKPRIHLRDGVYHVILRGNDRQKIFFCDGDRRELEELVARGMERYDCRIHAYCWMTNHIHMAIQVGDIPLSNLMRWMASQYAKSLNIRRGRTGHLFERRHRAILVDADRYLLDLVRYIHLNPVTAGIVDQPKHYRWSSHAAYLGESRVKWLTTGLVLSSFGTGAASARRRFDSFVGAANEEKGEIGLLEDSLADDRLLGGESFRTLVLGHDSGQPRATIDDVIKMYCDRYCITEDELVSPVRRRRHAAIRAEIAWEVICRKIASLAQIARRFGRAESVLSKGISRYLEKANVQ